MKKLILFIVIASLLVGGIYAYYNYEIPRKNNIEESIVNISISTKHNSEFIKSKVLIKNGQQEEIQTSETYQLVNLIKGEYNFTTQNLDFYTTDIKLNITKNQRLDIPLFKPKPIKYNKTEEDGKINIEVYSERFKNIRYCIDNSFSYIFIEPKSQRDWINFTKWKRVKTNNKVENKLVDWKEIRKEEYERNKDKYDEKFKEFSREEFITFEKDEKIKLEEYPNYECYNLKKSLIDSKIKLRINYEEFGLIDREDYIKLILIDSDFYDGELITYKEKDLWQENKEIKLK